MMMTDQDLPYFDHTGNEYARELRRQDGYLKRGGKLSAPQMIKYENRVAMLVEHLIAIHDAVKQTPEDVRDYLESNELTRRMGALPEQVYNRFKGHIETGHEKTPSASERERDRLR